MHRACSGTEPEAIWLEVNVFAIHTLIIAAKEIFLLFNFVLEIKLEIKFLFTTSKITSDAL